MQGESRAGGQVVVRRSPDHHRPPLDQIRGCANLVERPSEHTHEPMHHPDYPVVRPRPWGRTTDPPCSRHLDDLENGLVHHSIEVIGVVAHIQPAQLGAQARADWKVGDVSQFPDRPEVASGDDFHQQADTVRVDLTNRPTNRPTNRSAHAYMSSAASRCDTARSAQLGHGPSIAPFIVTPRAYKGPMDNQPPSGVAERADRFLRSTTGRATVHRTLANQRLPLGLADDLCQEVLRRVIVASSQRGNAIDNLEGFVTRALHHAAVDIVRGRIRSPQTVDPRVADPDADGWSWSYDAIASPLDVEADALAFESLVAVRRTIHQLLGLDPTAGAAALAYLAITVDGARTSPDCPQPSGGANPREAAGWVGLWYAGCDHCFPNDGDTATPQSAIRKRRSRAIERVHDLLVRSAIAAGLRPHNGQAQTPVAAASSSRQCPSGTTALVVSPDAPPAMSAVALEREGAVGG